MPVGEDKLLVAGYVGSPPRAYAGIVDLRGGSIEPIPVPGLEDSIRSEITGCTPSSEGILLYGYVQLANGTPIATIWLYRDGALVARRLNKVVMIPYSMKVYGNVVYLTGFIGNCEARGALAIIYALKGPLTSILAGNVSGYVFAPGYKFVQDRIYQQLGGKLYTCAYFTSVYQLVTGDILVLGYADNMTGAITGFTIKSDPLLQIQEKRFTPIPLAPVILDETDYIGVVMGVTLTPPVQPAVLIITRDGRTTLTRINTPGLKDVNFAAIDCMGDVCIVGGSGESNNKQIGILAIVQLNNTNVEYVHMLRWANTTRVTSVVVTPEGSVYVAGLKPENGGTQVVIAKLVLAERGSVNRTMETAEESGSGNGTLVVLAGVSSSIVTLSLLAVILARKRQRR
ncbi:hypothetical protein [Pyrolobus fumarii]|nr:hypothetical protein [Pyrolobus fumarii]